MRWKGSFPHSCWRVRYEIFVERLVFSCAERVAKRVAEDGIGFDLSGGRWWGGIRICGCHCLNTKMSIKGLVISNAMHVCGGNLLKSSRIDTAMIEASAR